jgi:hypothetical protein
MKDPVKRLMRTVQGLPDSTPAATAASPDAEVLARELSATFIRQLWKFRNAKDGHMGLMKTEEIINGGHLQKLRDKRPDAVTFQDLEALAHNEPEQALQLWEEVKAAARNDVANGWHAARDIGIDAWDRACFLAIRDQFRQTWPPRSGVEAMLIDEMTQYELIRRRLLRLFDSGSWICDKERGRQYPATAELGRTIERLQRLIHYALRTLLGIRRAKAMPVVQRIAPTIAEVAESGHGPTGLQSTDRHPPPNVPE